MLVAGRIENFKEHSQFRSLKEFNNNIEIFLADYKKDFTKGELIAFKRLVRFSAKFAGVANAKIGTLLKSINEKSGGFGVSRSTFERMLTKAKELGILTVKPTVKPKGGKGHNVYVFNTIDVLKKKKLTYCKDAGNPCKGKDEQSENEREAFNLLETSKNNNNHLNTRRSPYIKFVPKSLQHYRAIFGTHVKNIYSRVWLAAKKLGIAVDQQTMQQIGFKVLEQLKQYMKDGKQFNMEQQCRFAYKISYNQLQQGIDSGEIYDINRTLSIVYKAETMRFYEMRDRVYNSELDELGVF
jgi:hypothetical protein